MKLESIWINNEAIGYAKNGEWIASSSPSSIPCHSPIDGTFLGRIQDMQQAEIDAVIENSHEAQGAWAAMAVYERAEILNKAADLLLENKDEIVAMLVLEIAKDKKSAISEVERTADFIRYSADIGKSIQGEALNGENFPGGSKKKLSFVSRVPVGVVLAISPFNYPVNLAMSKIAPALIGGNAVVLKPATQGAIAASLLVEVMMQAGLPKGVLNTVTGRGSSIGDYLVTHPGIDFINFTGSSKVGHHIASMAGMIPQIFELGGKDAAIVLEDSDLDFVADSIVAGAYSYSGQRCTALKRILVMESIADTLRDKIKARVEKLSVGDPRDNATITPLIDDHAADFVQHLIDDAIGKGATLIVGNKREKNLLYPTLLDNVTPNMEIAWEEPFGPVLPIIRIQSTQEAINIANASEYGLQSSIFTQDIDVAFAIADQLEVGTVQINNKTERGPDHFPFLGVKASGLGTQGVKYSIEAMTRPKAIVVNRK